MDEDDAPIRRESSTDKTVRLVPPIESTWWTFQLLILRLS
jgi:hypothetical protein